MLSTLQFTSHLYVYMIHVIIIFDLTIMKIFPNLKLGRAAMKHTILILLISFLFISYSYAFQGKVIRVSDGDTISVMHDGKKEKIRL